MKRILIFAIFILFLFLVGCTEVNLENISDEDLERISEKAVVCNSPYMRMGISCCLDKDNNGICDSDEVEVENDDGSKEDEEVEEEEIEEVGVCNPPYMRMGISCCLDKDDNNICDSDEVEFEKDDDSEEDEEVVEEEIIDDEVVEEVDDSEKDEHGCIGTAGYLWNEEMQKCTRPWEEDVIEEEIIEEEVVIEEEINSSESCIKDDLDIKIIDIESLKNKLIKIVVKISAGKEDVDGYEIYLGAKVPDSSNYISIVPTSNSDGVIVYSSNKLSNCTEKTLTFTTFSPKYYSVEEDIEFKVQFNDANGKKLDLDTKIHSFESSEINNAIDEELVEEILIEEE